MDVRERASGSYEPKYIGHNVYNRRSYKLKRKRVKNPPEELISTANAFEALVSPEIFEKAQQIDSERHRHYTNDDLLARLRALLQRVGYLSGFTIDEAEDMPSSAVYHSRFGSLLRAYSLIGGNPGRNYRYLEINRNIRAQHKALVRSILDQLSAQGVSSIETRRPICSRSIPNIRLPSY